VNCATCGRPPGTATRPTRASAPSASRFCTPISRGCSLPRPNPLTCPTARPGLSTGYLGPGAKNSEELEMSFTFRGLELNSHYVWNFDWVKKSLDFVRRNQMTALVLHRNEIVDQLVYPAGVFAKGQEFENIFDRYRVIHRDLYKYVARGRSTPMQLRDYLRRVVEQIGRAHV